MRQACSDLLLLAGGFRRTLCSTAPHRCFAATAERSSTFKLTVFAQCPSSCASMYKACLQGRTETPYLGFLMIVCKTLIRGAGSITGSEHTAGMCRVVAQTPGRLAPMTLLWRRPALRTST